LAEGECFTYGGNTLEEFEQDFQDAVDEYLEYCAEHGKEPTNAYKNLLSEEFLAFLPEGRVNT